MSAPGEGWWLAADGRWYPPDVSPPQTDPRAGASAAAKARELAQLAERYQRESQQWAKGAEGERVTARWLAALPPTHVVLHDLHVPGSNANVDHLVIGPTGVFLVDSKAYAGELRAGSGTMWNGNRPIRREVETVRFIAGRVAEHLDVPVHPILCFTEATLPEPMTALETTRVIGPQMLAPLLTGGAPVHSPAMVHWLARLAGELTSPTPQATGNATPFAGLAAPGKAAVITTAAAVAAATDRVRARGSAAPKRAKRQPGRTRPAKKPDLFGPILGLIVVGVLLYGLNNGWTLGIGANQEVPTAAITFECPSPGAGYTATVSWAPTPSIFDTYEVVITGGPFELKRTANPTGNPPGPIPGIAPDVPVTVRTTRGTGADARSRDDTATSPATPC